MITLKCLALTNYTTNNYIKAYYITILCHAILYLAIQYFALQYHTIPCHINYVLFQTQYPSIAFLIELFFTSTNNCSLMQYNFEYALYYNIVITICQHFFKLFYFFTELELDFMEWLLFHFISVVCVDVLYILRVCISVLV